MFNQIIVFIVFVAVSFSVFSYETVEEIEKSFNNKIIEKPVEGVKERMLTLMPMNLMLISNLTTKEIAKDVKIDTSKAPYSIDLRPRDSKVKSQWNGTCTAFGMTAYRENLACVYLGECGLDMSERHFWSFYSQYSAEVAIDNSSKFVAMEKDWAQTQEVKPSKIDTKGIYSIKNMRIGKYDKSLLIDTLGKGLPVYFWSQVPQDMLDCKKNISSSKMVDGGHAYLVSGYINKADPILIVKNSWGEVCGDKGYQYMKLSIFDKAGYWNFAISDGVEKKTTAKCQTVCKPTFLIFGKTCKEVCE